MNILSIDVEDYFMVTALEEVVKRCDWDRYESRIERNTCRLLDIVESCPAQCTAGTGPGSDRTGDRPARATFFCLGWLAERHPQLIKEIHARGHEIASHGYDHRRVSSMSPDAFREDIRKSKALLEDITGERVVGYRAPSYSITSKNLWAFEVLAEEGFLYDSSIFPIHHDLYGFPDAPRSPSFVMKCDQDIRFMPLRSTLPCTSKWTVNGHESQTSSRLLVEFPLCTIRIVGRNLPITGGGYFRLFPIHFTRWAMARIKKENEIPFIFYIHPWEIDPDQPRMHGLTFRSWFRHYLNIGRTERRLKTLLCLAPFFSFRDLMNEHSLVQASIPAHV